MSAAKTKTGRTKAADRTGQKRSSGPGRGKKVWHITDFAELYELADDVRKERSGPLRYTKSHVTLSPFCPDAESAYFERMRRLKARPERHLLRSIFEDLKNWTGSKPYGLRGFLVTAEGKAASCEYLAEQLTLSVEDIKQSLPILEQLGFLERTLMNGQAEPKKPERKSARKKSKTGSTKTSKKRNKKSEQRNNGKSKNAVKRTVEHRKEALPESAGMSRNETESVCPPSRKDKNKAKGKSKSKGKGKRKATSGLTAPGCKDNTLTGSEDEETEKKKRVPKGCKDGRKKTEKIEESTAETAEKPEKPENPIESEVGSAIGRHAVPRPTRSVYHKRRGPQRIGDIIAARFPDHWSDSEAEAFGWDIVEALGMARDAADLNTRSEWGAFASWFSRVKAAAACTRGAAIGDLRTVGVKKAEYLRRKAKSAKNKSAVWFTIMAGELSKRGFKLPATRAGP